MPLIVFRLRGERDGKVGRAMKVVEVGFPLSDRLAA